jgi:broad-specificity NMP kinase
VIGMSSSESISSFFKQTYEKLPKKGIVNIYGSPGCGKTYFFKTLKHIKFDHDILKTKEKTDDFMKMMQASLLPLVLDDFNLIENLPGVKAGIIRE